MRKVPLLTSLQYCRSCAQYTIPQAFGLQVADYMFNMFSLLQIQDLSLQPKDRPVSILTTASVAKRFELHLWRAEVCGSVSSFRVSCKRSGKMAETSLELERREGGQGTGCDGCRRSGCTCLVLGFLQSLSKLWSKSGFWT